MTGIDVVMRGEIEGFTVDLVFHSIPHLVESFDTGINRSWFDFTIHDTPEAKRDRENSTVTLLLTDREERSRQRFERFNLKMGMTFTLVEPHQVPA